MHFGCLILAMIVGIGDCSSPPHVSPYWRDPENHSPNFPPTLNPHDFRTPDPTCPLEVGPCNTTSQFRSVSGRCISLTHPDAGTFGNSFLRIIPGVYDNGIIRMFSKAGGLLPNPRVISLKTRQVSEVANRVQNILMMEMGQLIDHDMSITTVVGGKNCAPCDSWKDGACIPILVPLNDPFISPFIEGTTRRRCLAFTRCVADFKTTNGKTTLEQTNRNNAYIDLSMIYGNDECRLTSLRQFSGGLLSSSPQGTLMLKPKHFHPACRTPDGMCFFSGDVRANENIGLTIMHELFHREHNRIAKALHAVNPHWNDGRLFQEARRINMCQYQHITYNEYLVNLLGKQLATEKGLTSLSSGFLEDPVSTSIPGVFNEFTAGAFRLGHSQIQGHLIFMDQNYMEIDRVDLVQSFHNSTLLLEPGRIDSKLRGSIGQLINPTGLFLVEEVLNKLFQIPGRPNSGFDLKAFNIARGRDHGVAPYTAYLKKCGILHPTSFHDLLSVMSFDAMRALKHSYAHVDDIDLFPGGLAENHLPGAMIGPTFACILIKQFHLLKTVDRFWYERGGSGLNLRQIESLRKTTLSRIVCNNMDQPSRVPRDGFKVPSASNPLQPCDSLPDIDFQLWQEFQNSRQPCNFRGTNFNDGDIVPVSPCLTCRCEDGKVKCFCDSTGCSTFDHDFFCKRVCGHI